MKNFHSLLVLIIVCSFSSRGFSYIKTTTKNVEHRPLSSNNLHAIQGLNVLNDTSANISITGYTSGMDYVTNGSYTTANGTNAKKCMLQLRDNSHSIQEIILRHKKNGVGLIYFTFEMDSDLSDDIIDGMVYPQLWIWASKTFGSNILLLKESFYLFIHRYIQLGIIEERVQLKVIPRFCLKSCDMQELIELILKTFIQENAAKANSLIEDRICIEKMRLRFGGIFSYETLAEFYYSCFYFNSESNITESELKESISMNIFNSVLVYSYYLTFTFILSLLSYKIVTKRFGSDNRIQLFVENDNFNISVEDLKYNFIHSEVDSFKLCSWIYDNLYRCQIQENQSEHLGKCCHAPPLFCFKAFTWQNCCKKFLVTLNRPSLFFNFLFNQRLDEKSISHREKYALKKEVHSFGVSNTFLKIIFILYLVLSVCFLIIFLLLILIKNRIIKNIKLAFSSVKCSRVKYDNFRKFIKTASFYPFRKFGLFGIFLLPLTLFCFVALIFQSLFMCRFMPIRRRSRSKVLIFYLYILLVAYPLLYVIVSASLILFGNLCFCLIIAVLNYGTYLKYLIFSIISVFYVINCFSKMSKKYHTFYLVLKKSILDKSGLGLMRKCNRCFFITRNKQRFKLQVENYDPEKHLFLVKITGGFPVVMNEINKVLISRKLFRDMSAQRSLFKELPGTPFSNVLSTLCHLFCIFFFLFFIFLIIINFGEDYIGSDRTQALAIFVSSLLPWVIKQYMSESVGEIDTSPEFQYVLEKQISIHEEKLRLKIIDQNLYVGMPGEREEALNLSGSEIDISVDPTYILEIGNNTT